MPKFPDIPRLAFKNAVFHSGVNVTVRRGPKWLERFVMDDETTVVLTDDEKEYGKAKVVGVYYVPFHVLRNDVLMYEHDPRCRTLRGLRRAMEMAYPGFGPSEMVTVLFFVPEKV